MAIAAGGVTASAFTVIALNGCLRTLIKSLYARTGGHHHLLTPQILMQALTILVFYKGFMTIGAGAAIGPLTINYSVF